MTKDWTKGYDFMDNSPRYTFEGRDPSYTYDRLRVVIYQKRVYDRTVCCIGQTVKRYFVYVYDNDKECLYSDERRPFKLLADAKKYAEECFDRASLAISA
jgi:hypothetical protein